MKMKRMIASVLALLLMVSLLPIGVMADTVGNNPKDETVTEIASGKEMEVNAGTIETNNGMVIQNEGTVGKEQNGKAVEGTGNNSYIETNNGTVISNNGRVANNGGTVKSNNDTIVNNYGTVNTNNGTVETNAKDGKIETNNGTVGKKDKDGNAVAGTGNYGTIETNNGTVITNNETGTVETNAKGGEIETNNGTVGDFGECKSALATAAKGCETFEEFAAAVAGIELETGNFGTITDNEGDISYNGTDGFIETNNGYVELNNGTVKTNNSAVGLNTGTVETNNTHVGLNTGTVETNNWYVELNNGKVETNDGYVVRNTGIVKSNDFVALPEDAGGSRYGVVLVNDGSVETNNGVVNHNGTGDSQQGVIDENHGAILMNYGTVKTNGLQLQYADGKPVVYEGQTAFGTIEYNVGTVETNAIDGVVNNYRTESKEEGNNNDADSSKEEPVVLQGTVEYNFGTVYDFTECVKGDDKPTIYYGLSWGENTDHLNLIDGAVKAETEKNLDEIARSVNNSGYRMTGYTAYYREGGKDIKIEETNRYIMNAPTWLKILWEKIVTAVESHEPEAKPEKKMSIPTTLSADQVKVGAYVRQGNLLFRIIEVGDDYIRVATVPKLSEQALADMLGFLKQHLSDAQIAKINGEPALLEQELVTYFFGGTFEHISFYAAPDLFA